MRNVVLRILEIIAAGVTIAGLLLGWYMGAGGFRPGLVCIAKPGVTQGYMFIT